MLSPDASARIACARTTSLCGNAMPRASRSNSPRSSSLNTISIGVLGPGMRRQSQIAPKWAK
jgi:hypothetical protein